LLAVDEDREYGLIRLVACLTAELELLISALGRYHPAALDRDDVWAPTDFSMPVVPAQHIPSSRKATSA
jgi:hypothetical protein